MPEKLASQLALSKAAPLLDLKGGEKKLHLNSLSGGIRLKGNAMMHLSSFGSSVLTARIKQATFLRCLVISDVPFLLGETSPSLT